MYHIVSEHKPAICPLIHSSSDLNLYSWPRGKSQHLQRLPLHQSKPVRLTYQPRGSHSLDRLGQVPLRRPGCRRSGFRKRYPRDTSLTVRDRNLLPCSFSFFQNYSLKGLLLSRYVGPLGGHDHGCCGNTHGLGVRSCNHSL